jgi:hypothetical protein
MMLAGVSPDYGIWRARVSVLPLSSVDPLLYAHFVLSQCLEVVGLGFSVSQLLLRRGEYWSWHTR